MEYKPLLKYPHLGPEDAAIWQRFIEKSPDYFLSVDYDVRVGEGRDYSEAPDDIYKADLIHLSRKRIDVVAFDKATIYVIELKPKATFSAVGQAVGLAQLYKAEKNPPFKVIATIITDAVLPDMLSLCGQMGVLLLLA